MADLFTAHGIDPAVRSAVIAELRAKAAEFAEIGRNAIPGGMCGIVTTYKDGQQDGPHPSGLYSEEKTLEFVAGIFKRMLDAAEGIELYQPCNGSEGRAFMAQWCERCTKDENHECEIVAWTMAVDVDDDDYPREWRQDGPKGPRCTAFEPKEGS